MWGGGGSRGEPWRSGRARALARMRISSFAVVLSLFRCSLISNHNRCQILRGGAYHSSSEYSSSLSSSRGFSSWSTRLPKSSVYPRDAAAQSRVPAYHGQPFSRAQRSTSMWPNWTAPSHVCQSHEQPSPRSHWTNSRLLPLAAYAITSSFIAKPPSPHSHRTSSRRPWKAAASAMV